MATKQSCYLCGNHHLEWISLNLSFGVYILQCSNCGLVQTEYVSLAAMECYYKTYYRRNQSESAFEQFKQNSTRQAQSQLAYIDQLIPDTNVNTAIEIGAGAGEMARALSKRNINIDVTELDPTCRKRLEMDPSIHVIDENELDNRERQFTYDMAILSHVLEHMIDPLHIIDQLSRLVKQGGYLFIELPNEVKMLKQSGFQGKGHLYFFTIDTFKEMIRMQGSFDIVDIRTSNVAIADFVASNYSLPYDFDNQERPDGISIRMLLRNRQPHSSPQANRRELGTPKEILDEYSVRMMKMYHKLMNLEETVKQMKDKYKASIKETSHLLHMVNEAFGKKTPSDLNK